MRCPNCGRTLFVVSMERSEACALTINRITTSPCPYCAEHVESPGTRCDARARVCERPSMSHTRRSMPPRKHIEDPRLRAAHFGQTRTRCLSWDVRRALCITSMESTVCNNHAEDPPRPLRRTLGRHERGTMPELGCTADPLCGTPKELHLPGENHRGCPVLPCPARRVGENTRREHNHNQRGIYAEDSTEGYELFFQP